MQIINDVPCPRCGETLYSGEFYTRGVGFISYRSGSEIVDATVNPHVICASCREPIKLRHSHANQYVLDE
jgi:predicted RNA-binding Zn-ribbon protein involved in translation (DUF1610 family)